MDSLVQKVTRTAPQRFVFAAVTVVALAALAACSSDSSDADNDDSGTSTTQSTTTSTQPADAVSRVRAATQASPERYHDIEGGPGFDPADKVAFDSPTRNITCFWSLTYALTCSLEERTNPPPEEDDCELDWVADVVILGPDGASNGICAGDPQGAQSGNVLPYGSGLQFDNYGCLSEKTGVTCVELTTGRGFTVSRSKFVTF